MKIKQTAYTTTLPSTKKHVRFRPFVVKEEKSLLLAIQDAEPKNIITTILDIVDACTFGELEVNKLPYFDVEYLFFQIRGKAVGESIDMVGYCSCEEGKEKGTPFVADIEDLIIEGLENVKNTVKIPNSEYGVVMRYPTIQEFVFPNEVETEEAAIEDVAAHMIKSIYDQEEVFDDLPTAEKVEFIESLTPEQQKVIADFVTNMPAVKLPARYTCKFCGKKHETFATGIERFFI